MTKNTSRLVTAANADVLGGAVRTDRINPRGFVPWSPQQATQRLLDQVQGVLREYEAHLPLTIRQIFYRLVGRHEYEKTERAYNRLIGHINRARRAHVIDMAAIRDDTSTTLEPPRWRDAEDFLAAIRDEAAELTLDRSAGQGTRHVVFCEAAGMAPQLARITHPFGIAAVSGGGFDSVTDKHKFARELVDHDRPTEVLHIGDHDPSGGHMFLALAEDVTAFARYYGGQVTFTRLAVTPAQIRDLSLPTAPANPDDKRAFSGDTCQAEAIAPDDLAAIVRAAIEERIDRPALDRVIRRERQVRRQLAKILGGG